MMLDGCSSRFTRVGLSSRLGWHALATAADPAIIRTRAFQAGR